MKKMQTKKVAVIGAGGIIGQHMMVNKPEWADAIFTRRKGDEVWSQLNVGEDDIEAWLNSNSPDVIVNLAGQNMVDAVEENPHESIHVNVNLPVTLATWVSDNNKRLIQVSTQGVFSGENANYNTNSKPDPITSYGKQKALAEKLIISYNNVKIVRLTFAIGVRPFQDIGRKNPLEIMMEKKEQIQVNDRFFSPVFAYDAATLLWDAALRFEENDQKITHIGNPVKCSRFSLASDIKTASCGKIYAEIEPVSHSYFSGIAPRPKDTTWEDGTSLYITDYMYGLEKCYLEWEKIKK